MVQAESARSDQVIHFTVEMAAAGKAPPAWRQAVLPARYPCFRRKTVLYEYELSAGFEHAPHLDERQHRI